jgi:uncharacterized membrane protein YGL010W
MVKKLFSEFFYENRGLEHELSYVNHFHHTKINQIMHTITIPFIFFFFHLFVMQTPGLGYILSFVLYLTYVITFCTYDPCVGVCWFFLYSTIHTLALALSLCTLNIFWLVYPILGLLTLMFQFLGHYCFEPAKFPAFR